MRQLTHLVYSTAFVGAALFFTQTEATAASKASSLEYNRDIRPILSENCFACHGADSASRKAGLRLDRFEDAILPRKDAKPAIVPGKPDDSEVVSRIFEKNEDDIMPPAKSHKVLTSEQKETLKRWIADGAKYQAHWSLIPPTRSAIPPVKNKRWVRNPIDAFVLARLEQEGLKPAPEADKRTLARRVALDLTGLPPTPEQVEAFVKDRSKNAYEKFVDQMLASPHWGEHRGRYWLDGARYGDSNGIHIDNYREMWSYRDWVINAYNQNMPFDEFTIEQLAGDLLPKPTLDQRVASGFNRCNITTSEGGAIDEEYLVLYARDRTETTSQVFLGLTTGCAVCHDHKFDRISQKEFYSLSAFFNNTTQKAMDGNVKDTPPILTLPDRNDRARWDSMPNEKAEARKRMDQRKESAKGEFQTWLSKPMEETLSAKIPKDKLLFHAALDDDSTNSLKVTVGNKTRTLDFTNAPVGWQEGAVASKAFTFVSATTPVFKDVGDFEYNQSFSYGAWLRLSDSKDGSAFARMDDSKDYRGWDLWLEKGRPGTHIVNKWPELAIKVVARKALDANRWSHVFITYDGSAKASGVKIYIDGELQEVEVQADKLDDKSKVSTKTKVPFKIGMRNKTSPLEKTGIQDLRLYGRVLGHEEVKDLGNTQRLSWLVSKKVDKRSKEESAELYTRWLTSLDEEYQQASAALDSLEKVEAEMRARATVAHVMQEKEMKPEAFVLSRGEYDKRRDKVEPATPAALPPMPKEFPRNRLGFAKWLLLPEHPLTARVTVNRFWQELFGAGIVRTPGDFGVTGDMPCNQELLDWMAIEFRESGWDIKKFYKMLVTSSTYRQAATTTPEKLQKDPSNRLLSRGPRFRMDAEMVRDYALQASGLLTQKIGGPSVKPYQPDGVWEAVAMTVSDTRNYKRDSGENLYRRSMYTFWKRSAPPASMDIFNAPSRESCVVRRERTDTPLQALVTLNDPQFVEAARNLAEHTLKEGGAKQKDRLDFMAEKLLARTLESDERKITESVLKDLMTHYKTAPKDAEALISVGESKADASLDKPTLAAYTMLANEMMNLDEVLNK
jgi:hypothetical protein